MKPQKTTPIELFVKYSHLVKHDDGIEERAPIHVGVYTKPWHYFYLYIMKYNKWKYRFTSKPWIYENY